MLFTSLNSYERYDYLEKKLNIAYQFLKQNDLTNLKVGSIMLDGGLVAQIQEYETNSPLEGYFETHDKHFDIQYVVSGEEIIEIADRDSQEIAVPYQEENDATLYQLPDQCSSILLKSGQFLVIEPEQAHKPRCYVTSSGHVKKIVIKVPL